MAATDNNRPPAALPPGTRLDEFELRRVLGIGGFGIVYLAFDHALEREVAIKEYMPSALVGRSDGQKVSLHGDTHADSFDLGLRSFVNEARLLARFDAPGLVKVHRYWEANNTAYMAMPFYAGSTLHAVRRRMETAPGEAWLRRLLEPLLDALARLHSAGIYHRDISPDNVILQPDGQPVLLDFGAARRVITDKSVALTAILKPAYAPIEQYAEAGAVKQGAWTDLYALGATLHFLLLGRAPPPATTRAVEDEMPPLARQPALLATCSAGFLQAVDWMLRPRPADRPQSVAALRAALAPQPAAPDEDDDRSVLDLSQLEALPPRQPPTPISSPSPTAPTPAATPGRDDDATVLLPRRDEATVLIPRRDAPAVQAPRQAAPAAPLRDEPTILMPRRDGSGQPAPHPDGVTLLLPLDDMASDGPHWHGDHAPTLRMPPPGSARPPAGDGTPPLQATRDTPMPRPAERQVPLLLIGVVVALLLAALLGWLLFKPALQPAPTTAQATATPASAPADAASATPATSATTAETAAITATTAATPTATTTATTSASSAAAAATPPDAAANTAATRTEGARTANRPAGTAAPLPTRQDTTAGRTPAVPSDAPARAGGPPGLATSITRLPPPDPAPVPATAATPPDPARQAAASPAPSASLASAAVPTVPVAVNPTTPPAVAALREPAVAALREPAVAALRAADTPVQPPRLAAREAEPVLLQTRALGPAERCEGRNPQALAGCIDRICRSEPGLRTHADCAPARATR